MNWISLGVFSVFLVSITTILQKSHASKNLNHTVITGSLYGIVSGIVVLIYAFVFGQLKLDFSPKGIMLASIAICIFPLGTWAFYKSVYLLNASVLTIILSLRAVFTAIFAVIFLGETIHTSQLIGMILIMTGVLFSQNIHKLKLNIKGVILSIIAAVIFGIGNVMERVIVSEMNTYLYLVPAFIIPGVILFIFQSTRLKGRQIVLSKITTSHIFLVGGISGVAGILSMLSLQLAPSSGHYAFVVQTRVIMVAVLAYIFLQEKGDIKSRLFAAFLSFLGLMLLSL